MLSALQFVVSHEPVAADTCSKLLGPLNANRPVDKLMNALAVPGARGPRPGALRGR
jgi:hypothetical protein